jgi:hypothetical protein
MPLLDHDGRPNRLGRVLASLALLGCVAALTALGLCAGFASASPFGRVAKHHPRLTIRHRAIAPIGALAPGDRAQRMVELRYRGTGRFTAVWIRPKIVRSSLLDQTKRGGLQLTIERCSKRWTKKRRTKTSVCRGKRWTVLKNVRLTRAKPRFRLRHLSRRAGRIDHLRLTVSLPAAAGNGLQGQRSRIAYRFVGVAR